MLPNSARIKNSSDFLRVTKSGKRGSTESLVGYLLIENPIDNANQNPKLGLIVGKTIGNSVVRHRIARQIRHAAKDQLKNLPIGSLLVVRALRTPKNAYLEAKELISKFIVKDAKQVSA